MRRPSTRRVRFERKFRWRVEPTFGIHSLIATSSRRVVQRIAVWTSEQGQHAPHDLPSSSSLVEPSRGRSLMPPTLGSLRVHTSPRTSAPVCPFLGGGNAFFRLGSFVQKVPGEISHEIHLLDVLCAPYGRDARWRRRESARSGKFLCRPRDSFFTALATRPSIRCLTCATILAGYARSLRSHILSGDVSASGSPHVIESWHAFCTVHLSNPAKIG